MGMPAVAYRWYFGAHSLKSLERNILNGCREQKLDRRSTGKIRRRLFRKWLRYNG
jgi:hypothetical protein